eukprot:scaffold66757_cov136-Cyclotella_meneghiniana.AAC.1
MRTYALLWEQCSPSVQGKLKGEEGWAAVDTNKDPVALIQRMKRVCCGFEAHKQPVHALVQSMKVLTTHIQQNETNEQYKEEFESIWEIVEQFGGSLTNHPELIERRAAEIAAQDEPPRDVGEVDDDDREIATAEIASEIKASFMLSGAQERRYGSLKLQLENDYTLGNDRYPKDTEGVLGLLNNYRDPYQRRQYRPGEERGGQPKEEDGLQFVQEGTNEEKEGAIMAQQGKKPGGEAKTNSKGESNCFHCGGKDHWVTDCPDLNEANKGSLMIQLDGALISQ